MKSSLDKPQPPLQKIRNILLRRSGFSEFNYHKNCEHPENLHLLRYFPKYYKTLRLRVTGQNPLLSKIKRIKKIKQIKNLSWASGKGPIKKNWLALFGNNRRDIEEIPQTAPFDPIGIPIYSFWTELSLREARFFYNIRRHSLPVGNEKGSSSKKTLSLPVGRTLLKFLKNMSWHNKRLEIYVDKENYDQVKWILERFKNTEGSLSILKMLKIEITMQGLDLYELLENKTVFSHLRDLSFFWELRRFDQSLGMIPQICKNLRSLSIRFERFFYESPEFPSFLLSVQELPKLETLKFRWLKDAKEFLKYLKPPSSLKHFRLSFSATDLIEGGSMESRDIHSYTNLVEHWEDIKDLETLECNYECESHEEVHFMRVFVTMVLKKVLKLKSFRCQLCLQEELSKSPPMFEPFVTDQVPHLYESLQNFRARLCDCYFPLLPIQFDLKVLKPFKGLKKIKLTGERISYVNVEEAVEILENNQKENGVLTKLSLSGMTIESKGELKGTLERISNAKRVEKDLKIDLGLTLYRMDEENKTQDLDGLCSVVNSIKPIKGLLLRLYLIECSGANLDEMRRIIERFPGMQNCIIQLCSFSDRFYYVKIDGTKEQLFSPY